MAPFSLKSFHCLGQKSGIWMDRPYREHPRASPHIHMTKMLLSMTKQWKIYYALQKLCYSNFVTSDLYIQPFSEDPRSYIFKNTTNVLQDNFVCTTFHEIVINALLHHVKPTHHAQMKTIQPKNLGSFERCRAGQVSNKENMSSTISLCQLSLTLCHTRTHLTCHHQ